jgi:hypothetical protein
LKRAIWRKAHAAILLKVKGRQGQMNLRRFSLRRIVLHHADDFGI